jgi:hypothetical protein
MEFKDLFLRDQCKIWPLVKDLINEHFNSKLIWLIKFFSFLFIERSRFN